MYFWYKLLTYLFYPFAPIYLYFRKLRKKEDLIRYKEKLSKINISRDNGFLVWFHVASVGEAMSILPLIESCIEEKKIDKLGFQCSKNFFVSIGISKGKNWWITFVFCLNLFSKILPELKVIDVTSILLIFCSSTQFSINGRMLIASPTLATWNQIKKPSPLGVFILDNFSLYLLESSFFLNFLKYK